MVNTLCTLWIYQNINFVFCRQQLHQMQALHLQQQTQLQQEAMSAGHTPAQQQQLALQLLLKQQQVKRE